MNLVITESGGMRKDKKPSICLNMIVKNESKVIVNTLTNLSKYIDFDYWVISDTGSTDNTQQIIRDFFLEKGIPGELFSHEWRDFGYNRTKALECAYDKTDYLLIFDADDNMMGDFKLPFTAGQAKYAETKYADRYMLKIGKGFEYFRPLLINNHKRWEFKGVLHEYLSNMEPVGPDMTVTGNYYIESGRTGNRSQNPTKYYDDAMILEKAYQVELALPNKGIADRYAFYCARSYKDAGEKYHDKAIEWYKKVLEKHNNWHQEKYYSALEIGCIYKDKKKMELAVPYLLKTVEYDMERIEGLIIAIEYFYQTGQYILINALYHKFKNYNRNLQSKLFINMNLYHDRLEFFNGISAHYINDKESGYTCCKQVLINQHLGFNELLVTINNLLCYREMIEKESSLPLFRAIDDLFCKHNELATNQNALDLWNMLFMKNRAQFTTLNKTVIKNIQKSLSVLPTSNMNNKAKILITFTTCKRFDLFKETMNSILNHWLDVDLITNWFCVDDNSSKEDRHLMKSTYHWMEYYMKTPEEKGHRASMNIIWNKLNTLKPTYWIHMEDDFLFYHPLDYIKQSISLLSNNNHNIKQLVFNRNYAEITEHYIAKGHLPMSVAPLYPNIVLHDYQPNDYCTKNYMNSQYWPHYSFRPSMILVKPILKLGNYDSKNQFFENDYAIKWNEAGYKTAFLNRITHRHIGRLTTEINDGKVKNAYELNNEAQFTAVPATNIRVINLERRKDRRLAVMKSMNNASINTFIFSNAVDGKTLESTNELKTLFKDNDFGNRKAVIGCALSHLQLWQELVKDEKNSYYIIFEDDISFNANVKERMDNLNTDFEKEELLFLGYHMFSSKRAAVKDIYDHLTPEMVIKIEPLNKDLYIGGTFGYSINKIGAQKLLDYIAINGIKHGIDYQMKITTGLNVKEIQPFLVYSDWYEEKDKPVDTDIQADFDSLDFNNTLEDHFDFLPQLDQIGHDLYFQPGPLTEYMSKALKDKKCVAFNTLGYFKHKIEKLTSSQYFQEKDGIYIKKIKKAAAPVPAAPVPVPAAPVPAVPVPAACIRLKMLCNWCSSQQLCKEWANMYLSDQKWKNIQMTASDDPRDIDYYVIINSPPADAHYVPEKTIVFQMEPWVADPAKNWGVKTWGEWAVPDPAKFFRVFTHITHLNNVQWQIDFPFYTKPISVGRGKLDKIAAICSEKNFDEGHLLRNTFIKYIENTHTLIDVWGRENYHHFQTYKGPVPADNKYNVYTIYKYCLAVENNKERNYATEKIWESILCESLCFYWGCPNLEEYIDEKAFVRLPLEDPAAALHIIQQAIAEDWWTQRIGIIKQMKEKILNELGFFPQMATLLKSD